VRVQYNLEENIFKATQKRLKRIQNNDESNCLSIPFIFSDGYHQGVSRGFEIILSCLASIEVKL
jgi:hypothetical protein